MQQAMLTVKELADLKGCSLQNIKSQISKGKILVEEVLNTNNRKKYLIPLTEIEPRLQKKYLDLHKKEVLFNDIEKSKGTDKKAIAFDNFTSYEREEIAFWQEILKRWEEFRNSPNVVNKIEADRNFVSWCKVEYPEVEISTDILYRKRRALKAEDIGSLVDMRGKWKKGACTIDENVWQIFLSFYLDQAQHPISKCYEYTQMYIASECPENMEDLPSYHTFYRHVVNDINEGAKVMGRFGMKAFEDRCRPYIKRTYENMSANEYWIADNHTFDVITEGGNGKPHRLYLTAFMDARSGIFTGCHITDAPCSQATVIALRKGILKYGIPENIYVDNGREFLTFDMGGLGHRKKKLKSGKERFEPPPIFERLGIKMTNAIVQNAKAKVIERRFCDIKNGLSRLFDTYTGGTVVERPEQLKHHIKNGNIIVDSEFTKSVETMLDWYFNQEAYGGAVVADRGKPKMQVFNEQLHSVRKASAEDLNLMLMRSARAQKVTRRGVQLTISGEKLDYWTPEFVMNYLGKEVYFRYDPDDLSEVRIYDLKDRFVMTVPCDNVAVAEYGASKEEIAEAMAKTHKIDRMQKEAIKLATMPVWGKKTALELVLAHSLGNKEAQLVPPANPKAIQIQRPAEEALFQQAVGYADLDIMNKNAKKKMEELRHGTENL